MTDRLRVQEIVAGYIATFAIFVAGLALVYRPVRLAPVAMLLVLVAAAIASERNARILQIALAACVIGWVGGMTAAVVTDNPLW